jgi:hypothetical protein
MENRNQNCQGEDIGVHVAAYLDGQLEISALNRFEAHLQTCQSCRAELNAQQQFLCELESALSTPRELPIPEGFARIVSARAESDMRGVRQIGERRRALLVCLALGAIAFALLGAAAGNSILFSGRLLLNKVLGVIGLLWTALHDAFVGLSIISRVVARMFLPQSQVTNLAALILLGIAVASLSHLIISYHRRRQMRLFE